MFYLDSNYLLFVLLPGLVLSLVAQFLVSSAYGTQTKKRNAAGVTGVQVADAIRSRAGLQAVRVEGTEGKLTDHFDPATNTIRLSRDVATVPSVASMAITAHEFGHAEQYAKRSELIKVRGLLAPAAQFSPWISYLLITIGLVLRVGAFFQLGVLFFGVVVLFMVLTLPVEFDASRRGLRLLKETGLLQSSEDEGGARSVLRAAALTYVAAAVQSVLQLLYYISMFNRRR